MKNLTNELHSMDYNDINQAAVDRLVKLTNYCSLNMITKLTGISRVTFYKWLDEDVTLDQMNHRDAAWFILHYETNPKIQMILDKTPSNPRLAHRIFEEDNAEVKV